MYFRLPSTGAMSINAVTKPPVETRERVAWALYDFANSGYTTVVLTTVFNAYFVTVVVGNRDSGDGSGTLLWTVALAGANALVLLSAPLLGAMADHLAAKKRFLGITTLGCVVSTALLASAGPGDVAAAMTLVIISCFMFGSSDNLIASFLPEISSVSSMGRLSGYGWSLGYAGGLLTLALCLAWVSWAGGQDLPETRYVPGCLFIVAAVYALASAPTFLWLRERAQRVPGTRGHWVRSGYERLHKTLREASRFKQLFRFLVALTVYQSGVSTVVVLAAIYATDVVGFETRELIGLIMVVNLTAAAGAFACGHAQDRFGSKPTLSATLLVWLVAISVTYLASDRSHIWIAGNLIGAAMGASQSAGRAFIGQLTPPSRTAEFFGLWGVATKFAAVCGPLSYGLINYATGGNHRQSMLSTLLFFVVGLVLLLRVDEHRGREAALTDARVT